MTTIFESILSYLFSSYEKIYNNKKSYMQCFCDDNRSCSYFTIRKSIENNIFQDLKIQKIGIYKKWKTMNKRSLKKKLKNVKNKKINGTFPSSRR